MKLIPEGFIRLAKEITESTNIDTIMEAARVLALNVEMGMVPTDPVIFPSFKDYLRTVSIYADDRYGKMEPYPWQDELAEACDTNRIVLALHGRQMGLTTVAMCYAAYSAEVMDNQKVLFMSHNFNTAKWNMKLLMDARPHVRMNMRNDCIEFGNGSTITFSGMQMAKKFMGERAFYHSGASDAVIIDNANFLPHKLVPDMLTSILPVQQTKFLIVSCAGADEGLLHCLYSSSLNAARLIFPWQPHGNFTQEWADKVKFHLSEKAWRQEYLCEVISSAENPKKDK